MQNTLAALLLIGGIYAGALAAVLAVVASGDRGILARPGTAVEGAADVEIDEATGSRSRPGAAGNRRGR